MDDRFALQQGEELAQGGVFEFVGPLVTPEPGEKPLSIALREIEAGLLDHEEGN